VVKLTQFENETRHGVSLPTEFVLEQNYPNPFNPSTTIKYSIPKVGKVSLKIYDILGKEIITLINEEKTAGVYEVNFDAVSGNRLIPSGIYFYQLRFEDKIFTKKMTIIKQYLTIYF